MTAPPKLTTGVRHVWAVPYIRRGNAVGVIPRYGSSAWRMLDNNDPRKVAACVVAAECWAEHVDTLEERLHDEIAAARREREDYEDEQWAAMATRVRQRANAKTWAEVEAGWTAS